MVRHGRGRAGRARSRPDDGAVRDAGRCQGRGRRCARPAGRRVPTCGAARGCGVTPETCDGGTGAGNRGGRGSRARARTPAAYLAGRPRRSRPRGGPLGSAPRGHAGRGRDGRRRRARPQGRPRGHTRRCRQAARPGPGRGRGRPAGSRSRRRRGGRAPRCSRDRRRGMGFPAGSWWSAAVRAGGHGECASSQRTCAEPWPPGRSRWTSAAAEPAPASSGPTVR